MQKKLNIAILSVLILSVIIVGIFNLNQKSVFKVEKNLPIYAVETKEKKVSLTFDVNYAEEDNLFRILDILDKYNIKGTFFVMGGWVNKSEENLDKLKLIHERGHEIGNHSYIHPMFTRISSERMVSEIKKTEDIIYRSIGVKTNLFRCPSGDYNNLVINVVNRLGYYCIQWDVDSVDWKNEGAEIEYNRVIKNIKPGSIILYHNDGKYTPGNLQKLIKNLKKEGYSFAPLGELIYKDHYIIDYNGRQQKTN
ncbi:polysaccharide deacetylase family sporulation protein PdaB [Clostridium polyendosporum]|uniref:Polysaccharide deacetylase family sporulation protein PdaB n=1 Tax=Clostridium polyendosporum TaxID=69208 RepID=A0A919RYG1_9CLOT|nr:polysaccharide deacetylase family protein [Clostridium polyendosporum]GIM28671.1 polysaccharide deacetylase family sporulation protein PdaB [Clostridium polyendosporum]